MYIVGEKQRERKTHGKRVKEYYAKLIRVGIVWLQLLY